MVTRYSHIVFRVKRSVLEAAHPVPDDAGVKASAAMLKLVQNLHPLDQVICLISGRIGLADLSGTGT